MKVCVVLGLIMGMAGCGGDPPEAPPAGEAGPCSFHITGDTTDAVEETTSVAFRDLVLYLSCERQDAGVAESRLSIKLKSYNGAHAYPVDTTDTYGELNYLGNDGVLYSTFASPDAATACAVEIVEGGPDPAEGDPFEATFSCQRLHGFGDAAADKFVDLSGGSMKGTFDPP